MEQGTALPFVSIIVPTYKDWQRLELCTRALSMQTYPAHSFEVIIANNEPADPAPATLQLPENCTIIEVAAKGSYAARNAGIRLAKGSIIGFTDSDCIPDRNWISNAVAHFKSHPACSRIAGHITIFFTHKTPSPAELYDSLYSFRQKRYAEDKGTCVTGNLFTRREVLEQVGLFDEKQYSFGDLIWGQRAQRRGYRIQYAANVLVQHPARKWKELVKKEKRLGGGQGMHKKGKVSTGKLFLSLINGCRPRMTEIKFVFHTARHMDFKQKCTVLLMRHYLLNLRTYEQMRVSLGKEPNRA